MTGLSAEVIFISQWVNFAPHPVIEAVSFRQRFHPKFSKELNAFLIKKQMPDDDRK
jgi:hypothetical protein